VRPGPEYASGELLRGRIADSRAEKPSGQSKWLLIYYIILMPYCYLIAVAVFLTITGTGFAIPGPIFLLPTVFCKKIASFQANAFRT
jgi:hypothetical protein